MPVWVLVVYGLAVARLAGLITTDDITHPARQQLLAALPDTPPGRFLAELITCPWCVSIWIGCPAAAVAWLAPTAPWFAIPALMLAFSQITGNLSDLGRGTPPAGGGAPQSGDVGAHAATVGRT